MDENLRLPIDQYQRYKAVSDIINKFRTKGCTFEILEVGAGPENIISKFLSTDKISFLDIGYPSEFKNKNGYIVGDILSINLDKIYDFVVSVDTYEHISAQNRNNFVNRLISHSNIAAVISAPFDTTGVMDVDIFANELYKLSHGIEHRWLREHIENSLPSLPDILDLIQQLGYRYEVIPNGYLPRWFEMMSIYLLTEGNSDFTHIISKLFEYYNRNFYEYDNKNPAYRQIIVVDKTGIPKAFSDLLCNRNESNIPLSKNQFLKLLITQIKDIYYIYKNRELFELTDSYIKTDAESKINKQISELEQLILERDAKIFSLQDRLQVATERTNILERNLKEIRQSIVWQMLTMYQIQIVDRALPCGTGRRNNYDMLLIGCRILVNEGCGIFISKVKNSLHKKIPFLKQRHIVPLFDANILTDNRPRVPFFLDEDLLIEFAFPGSDLCEIRVLTTTYGRINSDLILNISESINGIPIRKSRVKGKDIRDNDYTSFSFKPIKDSAKKTFFARLGSDGEPSSAIWYSSETDLPNIRLYKSEERIKGCIGFQALARFKINKDPYHLWILKNEPYGDQLDDCKEACSLLKDKPKISIITPVWNTDERWLRLAIESVLNQIYDNWELCIVDGGSTEQHVKKIINEYARKDTRIKAKHLKENKGIAGNSNEALSLATGEFVGFLDHDDELTPFSIYEVVKKINEMPMMDIIYSDEDKINEKQIRKEPFFKPDWSPDMFLSFNYLVHFTVIRKSLIDRVQGFREGYDGAQDYDLFLRVLDHVDDDKIAHIQKILYHWRALPNSSASSTNAKPYAYIAGSKALRDAMMRRNIEIEDVVEGLFLGSYRIIYKIKRNAEVAIIIPTKDKVDILRKCIDSILNNTKYPYYNIVIVDNNSRDEITLRYYDTLKTNKKIKLLCYNKDFNYAAINNFAVSQIDSEYILFLNNDTEVISEEWLGAMLEHAQRSKVGAVGAKLVYPNNLIQHCGVILGRGPDRVAGHYYYRHRDYHGYFGTIDAIRNYSAITAACMMTKKTLFDEMGGFDEKSLAIAFNDIDYCLRLRCKGYLIVYTPFAKLYHHESLSRGYEDTQEKQIRFSNEAKYMREKFGCIIDNGDPYYNVNQMYVQSE